MGAWLRDRQKESVGSVLLAAAIFAFFATRKRGDPTPTGNAQVGSAGGYTYVIEASGRWSVYGQGVVVHPDNAEAWGVEPTQGQALARALYWIEHGR